MSNPKPAEELCAIGEVSALTGLSPHTIRVWERRYGMPVAVRLPSGHRRYARAQVALLQTAAELVALGHRPSKILTLPAEEIERLIQEERHANRPALSEELEKTLVAPPTALRLMLDRQIQEHGMRRTVHEFLVPLIQRIGQAWVANEIDIHREHMLSEAIQDVLRAARLQVQRSNPDDHPVDMILATLPGERHGLGLQMLSLLAVLDGAEPLLLGVDLPVQEMVDACAEHPGAALILSISSASDVTTTSKQLKRLRDALPQEIPILVGGEGLPQRSPIPGIQPIKSLLAFEEWVTERKG